MKLWRAVAAARGYLVAAVACGVLIAGCAIGSAIVLAHIVAAVITDPGARALSRFGWPLAILAALWCARTVGHWLAARLAQRGATAVIADLGGRVLRAVSALPPRQLAERRDAAAAVVARGLDGLRPYFSEYLPSLFLAVILTPAATAAIACFDIRSAAIVMITLPLIPIFMVLIGLTTREKSAATLNAVTTLQARMLDLVAGLPTLRAMGRAGGAAARIAELSAGHRRSTMATLRVAFLSALVLELLATLGVALVAVSIGLRLVFGQMTLAAGLTALLLAPEVFWPLRRVGVAFHAAQDGNTAAEAALGIIGIAPQRRAGTRTVAGAGAVVRIDTLSVAGRDGPRPESLCAVIEPGRVTVLTGPNGCGKSTTLAAVAGVTPASSGRVTVDGVDLADLDLNAWWRQIAWLPQRPVLVAGTVRDNLELFGPLNDAEAACRATGFDDVLARLPDGVLTTLGRGGVGLSLGERQRLGLARALGSQAPVLLLDEPTAHLDAQNESRALRAIVERARAGATVLVVGHRAPVLAIGDVLVVVEREHALI